jgi:hypothetical protein
MRARSLALIRRKSAVEQTQHSAGLLPANSKTNRKTFWVNLSG